MSGQGKNQTEFHVLANGVSTTHCGLIKNSGDGKDQQIIARKKGKAFGVDFLPAR